MRTIKTITQITRLVALAKAEGKTIGFVPTMGFLHQGHLSLIEKAVKETDFVIVSIFVNPTQFGPKEDYRKYPRNIKQDLALCRKYGVDVVFYPTVKMIYPDGYKTYVEVEEITDTLCGASRPGHFKGVTTIVAKLFNIVSADIAYFGQKDAQQAIVISQMVRDLNMQIKTRILPIIREKDGLALSSRNIYLNPSEREDAKLIYKSLQEAKNLIKSKCNNVQRIRERMRRILLQSKRIRIDYISLVDAKNLKTIKNISGKVLIAVAVKLGKTRLIDNIIIKSSLPITCPQTKRVK